VDVSQPASDEPQACLTGKMIFQCATCGNTANTADEYQRHFYYKKHVDAVRNKKLGTYVSGVSNCKHERYFLLQVPPNTFTAASSVASTLRIRSLWLIT
jgi:hypothetical protein